MKRISILFCFILLILITSFTLTACKKNTEQPEEKNDISYIQTGFYKGENKDFEVKISKGNKEVLFVADGKTNECKDFCAITVIPSSVDLFNNEYEFVITGETGEINGKLNKDSFGAYYEQDVDVSSIGEISKVTISYGKKTQEITVTNMLKDCLDAKQALEKAREALSERLSSDDKDREIYIRMINNTGNPKSEYYWYVAFIANPTDYYACLINPADGTVVSCTK